MARTKKISEKYLSSSGAGEKIFAEERLENGPAKTPRCNGNDEDGN